MVVRSSDRTNPIWIVACRGQHRVVVYGDEFAIARDQIADERRLVALAAGP